MGPEERIPQDWFAQQVALADRTDGDIDTLATRIAHIRTWTFVSNRIDWLADPEHWQDRTRAIEDSLSDALHERLTQRFVDRRTSALMKGLKEKDELYAEIADDGAVHVEKHFVGRLNAWMAELIGERLKPLVEIDSAQDIAGLARGIAFRLKENFGVLRRESIAEEIRSLDQPARAQLRKYGVRFGAFNIYFPAMQKPACSELAAVLWILKHGTEHGLDIAAMPELPRPGLTSAAVNAATPDIFYGVA